MKRYRSMPKPSPACWTRWTDLAAGLAVICLVALAGGCRGPAPESTPGGTYRKIQDAEPRSGDFETPPQLTPAEALPDELQWSLNHEVVGRVDTSAFANRYRVLTPFGEVEVDGTDRLRKRVHEFNVMGALEEHRVRNRDVYALAAANAATSPLEGAAQLITRPVRTLRGIPLGAWNYGRRVAEMTRGERTHAEDSYGAELSGFAEAKRQWAYRLGVDVYSRNELLQSALSRFARAAFAGGLSVRLPMMVVTGAAGSVLTVSNTAEGMRRRLRDESPEDIRRENREALQAMGAAEAIADGLVAHPWYTPTEQLTIVTALQDLEHAVGRESFVEVASEAGDPEGTWFYARMALMLDAYHAHIAPIAEVAASDGLIFALAATGDVVVPLVVDYGVWSPAALSFFDRVQDAIAERYPNAPRIAWISGQISPRAHRELAARGWQVWTRVSAMYLAEYDREMERPGKPPDDRILPEIGGSRGP